MRRLDEVTREDLRELLGKGWLTHDGMWFHTVNSAYGTNIASVLNKKAIAAMAPFEVQRLSKALDLQSGELNNAGSIAQFLTSSMRLILPDSVINTFSMETIAANQVKFQWQQGECFAFKGMSRIGVIGQYDCGVMFRIECWFRALKLQFATHPVIIGCLMHRQGSCSGVYEFQF